MEQNEIIRERNLQMMRGILDAKKSAQGILNKMEKKMKNKQSTTRKKNINQLRNVLFDFEKTDGDLKDLKKII